MTALNVARLSIESMKPPRSLSRAEASILLTRKDKERVSSYILADNFLLWQTNLTQRYQV